MIEQPNQCGIAFNLTGWVVAAVAVTTLASRIISWRHRLKLTAGAGYDRKGNMESFMVGVANDGSRTLTINAWGATRTQRLSDVSFHSILPKTLRPGDYIELVHKDASVIKDIRSLVVRDATGKLWHVPRKYVRFLKKKDREPKPPTIEGQGRNRVVDIKFSLFAVPNSTLSQDQLKTFAQQMDYVVNERGFLAIGLTHLRGGELPEPVKILLNRTEVGSSTHLPKPLSEELAKYDELARGKRGVFVVYSGDQDKDFILDLLRDRIDASLVDSFYCDGQPLDLGG